MFEPFSTEILMFLIFIVFELLFMIEITGKSWIFEQGVKFLELCGFERVEGGKYLFLPRGSFDMEVFKSAANELQSAITNPFFGLLSTGK